MPHPIILDVASPAPSTNSVHVAAASYPACVETVTYESDYWHWAQPAPTTAVMNTPDLPTFSPALYPTLALLFVDFFDSPNTLWCIVKCQSSEQCTKSLFLFVLFNNSWKWSLFELFYYMGQAFWLFKIYVGHSKVNKFLQNRQWPPRLTTRNPPVQSIFCFARTLEH